MALIHDIAKNVGREVIYPVGRKLVDFGLKGSLSDRLAHIDSMVDVQTADGNWNADPYMRGLANGLLLAQHTLHGWDGEPAFMEHPTDGYLFDTPEKRASLADSFTPETQRNGSVSLEVESYSEDEVGDDPLSSLDDEMDEVAPPRASRKVASKR